MTPILALVKKNKLKIIFGTPLIFYIVFCQSCLTMRTTTTETNSYFTSNKIAYTDSMLLVNKSKIHYIETGNKNAETLLFVHGSPGSWDAFKKYLSDSLLHTKYRLIALDRPGFGYSNFGQSEDLFDQVEIIQKFVKNIDNGKKIHLIGHSYGGPVIVQMAIDKPEMYSSIIVLSGAVDPSAEAPERWRKIFLSSPIRYIVPGALRPSNDELWWLKDDLKLLKPTLSQLTCKVIIIHGTKDQLVPYSNADFMQKAFINAQSVNLISIEGANHFIPWEHYSEIRNALLQL